MLNNHRPGIPLLDGRVLLPSSKIPSQPHQSIPIHYHPIPLNHRPGSPILDVVCSKYANGPWPEPPAAAAPALPAAPDC